MYLYPASELNKPTVSPCAPLHCAVSLVINFVLGFTVLASLKQSCFQAGTGARPTLLLASSSRWCSDSWFSPRFLGLNLWPGNEDLSSALLTALPLISIVEAKGQTTVCRIQREDCAVFISILEV